MKHILNILILLWPFFALAQIELYLEEPTDKEAYELQKVFNNSSNDTLKMEVSRKLAFYYHEKNSDSALLYQTQQLELAQKFKFPLWEADALELSGFIYRNMDRYPVSLQYFQKALRISEDPKSKNNYWRPEILSKAGTPEAARLTILAFTYLDMAGLYGKTGNNEKELSCYTESLRLSKILSDTILLSLGYGSIGGVYLDKKLYDSALYYTQLEINYTEKSGYYKYYGSALSNLAIIYFKLGDHRNASMYFKKAILEAKKYGNLRNLGHIYLDFSEFYFQAKQNDSSLYFARKSLLILKVSKSPSLELRSDKMLNKVFDQKGMIDSAYYYLKAAIVISDSMFSEEKMIHLQNLEYSEQLRLITLQEEQEKYYNKIRTRALISGLILILVVTIILYRNSHIRRKAYKLVRKQRNELQTTLGELKSTQSQLIHAEKMASLGELTAGIAHEIQNPLNFVNNFSELSTELIEEMYEELGKGKLEEVKDLASDIKGNLEKINHHGRRADSIVKGMLQHSRSSSGLKELTDINDLADEYFRLAYHGLRAKDSSFNASLDTDFDQSIGKIEVIPQDLGRVLLNLISNAFYACTERKKLNIESYEPKVSIMTSKKSDMVYISIKDNGNGIPQKVLDKIFQPFFTTKPTGEGTGLGLSISYDIITKGHGGSLKVKTKEGEGTEFIIQLIH